MPARRKLGRGRITARNLNTSLLLIAHFGKEWQQGARLEALLAMGSLRRRRGGGGVPGFPMLRALGHQYKLTVHKLHSCKPYVDT